jgi:hypothetical protein
LKGSTTAVALEGNCKGEEDLSKKKIKVCSGCNRHSPVKRVVTILPVSAAVSRDIGLAFTPIRIINLLVLLPQS